MRQNHGKYPLHHFIHYAREQQAFVAKAMVVEVYGVPFQRYPGYCFLLNKRGFGGICTGVASGGPKVKFLDRDL